MNQINPANSSRYALELSGVRKKLGGSEILRGVDLQVSRGEKLVLIGPNGAGKSSLFNVISGRTQPDAGSLLLHGQAIQGLAPQAIYRRGLSRSFQISHLFLQLSVVENLRLAALWHSGCRYAFWQNLSRWRGATERAEQLLELLGLQAQAQTLAINLSYAEQRHLELAMTLAGDSSVILLDEPTAGMSRAESDAMIALIKILCRDKTLLMIEHDMNVVFGLAERIAVLVYGQILACDVPQAVRDNPEVQQAYLGTAKFRLTQQLQQLKPAEERA